MKECLSCLKKELSSILDFVTDFFLTTCNGIRENSNLFLVLIAFFTSVVTYDEFIFKRRPFAIVEQLTFENRDGKLIIKPILSNPGNYPINTKLNNVTLSTSQVQFDPAEECILSPTISNSMFFKMLTIDTNLDFNSKTKKEAILTIEISSAPIDSERFEYITKGKYQITTTEVDPPRYAIKDETSIKKN